MLRLPDDAHLLHLAMSTSKPHVVRQTLQEHQQCAGHISCRDFDIRKRAGEMTRERRIQLCVCRSVYVGVIEGRSDSEICRDISYKALDGLRVQVNVNLISQFLV